MIISRGDDGLGDLVVSNSPRCARCGYGEQSADLSNHPGPLVWWHSLDGWGDRKAESIDLVFHPACALEFAAHLQADAIEARTTMKRFA